MSVIVFWLLIWVLVLIDFDSMWQCFEFAVRTGKGDVWWLILWRSLLLPPVARSVLNGPNLFIFICSIIIFGTWLTPPQKALHPHFLPWKKNKCHQKSTIHEPDFIKVRPSTFWRELEASLLKQNGAHRANICHIFPFCTMYKYHSMLYCTHT